MRYLTLLIGLFMTTTSFAQMGFNRRWLTEEDIKGKGIKMYTTTVKEVQEEKTFVHGLVLEAARLTKEGDEKFHYFYNFDVTNTTDSIFFQYNEKGQLTRKVKIYGAAAQQEDGIGKSSRMSKSIYNYHYNSQGLLEKIEYFRDEDDEKPEISKYAYNDKGLKASYERLATFYPESNNTVEQYTYNQQKQLIRTAYMKMYNPKDTIVTTQTYNKNGLLSQKIRRNGNYHRTTDYTYDEQNHLIKEIETVGSEDHKRVMVTTYQRNQKGLIEEEKYYVNDELKEWLKFTYNEQGLKTQHISIDTKTQQEQGIILFSYELW